jgi:hypothetical protein
MIPNVGKAVGPRTGPRQAGLMPAAPVPQLLRNMVKQPVLAPSVK